MFSSFAVWHILILAVVPLFIAAVIWAIVVTVRDESLSEIEKLVWVLVLAFAPVIGLALWLIVRAARRPQAPPVR